jgi:uroporphyrinogen III methyltransferase / synthase
MTPCNLPLAGKRILVTRAREQSAEFSRILGGLGGEAIEFPTIEILPPRRWNDLDRAIDEIESYDWLIFTSGNGVIYFWQRLAEKGKGKFPSSSKICAIGPATARQLRERKTRVDYVPKEYIAEAILEGFEKVALQGKRILLARARIARDILPKGLRQMGAEVDVVEAYRTVKPRGGTKKLKALLLTEKVDAITFTSSSTVNHFAELLKKEDMGKILRGVTIACIGPVTSRTAKERGFKVHVEPKEYTIPGLARALAEYFQNAESGVRNGE